MEARRGARSKLDPGHVVENVRVVRRRLGRAKEALRSQVATLVVSGAERVLAADIDANRHAQLLDQLATDL